MQEDRTIRCPKCDIPYLIPRLKTTANVNCKKCGHTWLQNPLFFDNKSNVIATLGVIAIIIIVIFVNEVSQIEEENWVVIDYGQLIDKSIITHSGETIDQVLSKPSNYVRQSAKLLQPYLEPQSILCNDALNRINEIDSISLKNVTDHYPIGSAQPAWVAIFREGHHQIFYNTNMIRVFLGTSFSWKDGLEKYKSLIRHPIASIINDSKNNIKSLEFYTFNNHYRNNTISLNTIPYKMPIEDFTLEYSKNIPDLKNINEFLTSNIQLEAAEIDGNNDLYLYGIETSSPATIAGKPMSISDLAVIYRSIFHCGSNDPYISLDTHEDNRYAKVNFGGLLENTRAGEVVLEADRLFKSLGSGIDAVTKTNIKENFRKNIPGFYTEDERGFIETSSIGRQSIRYWFYPDSIGTVTDGNIGAITTCQFYADIERMDKKVSAGIPVRKTINHLNQNYVYYESAHRTYKELSNVGRLMAIVNYFKYLGSELKIDLDELLSVTIPAHKTPKKTKKLLAVTTIAHSGNKPSEFEIINNTNIFDLSEVLNNEKPTITEDEILTLTKEYIPTEAYYNDDLRKTYKKIEKINDEAEILKKEIDRKKPYVNSYSSYSVNSFNELVDAYNDLIQKSRILSTRSNLNELQLRSIASVGGGIDLSPRSFKKTKFDIKSPKLKRLQNNRGKMKIVGNVSKRGNWIRNIIENRQRTVNSLPNYSAINDVSSMINATISIDGTTINYSSRL